MVFAVQNHPFKIKLGLLTQSNTAKDFYQTFQNALQLGFDFIISNIQSNLFNTNPFELSSCFIQQEQFNHIKLQHIIPYIKSKTSKLQIGYCIYLGIKYLVLQFNLKTEKNVLLFLQQIQFTQNKISIILHVTESQAWFSFKNIKNRKNISVMLNLCPNYYRWLSEEITLLVLKKEKFILNANGYPMLQQNEMHVIKQVMRLGGGIVLQNLDNKIIKYLGFVFQNVVKKMSIQQIQAYKIKDQLLSPLQPYINNLEADIYSIFQLDRPKYDAYQKALQLAFNSLSKQVINIYYIGCGRGGLIQNIINASEKMKKQVRIYAIDKNPYPIHSLKKFIVRNNWTDFVTVIEADIKQFKIQIQPHILLSELLGGFGDNELSPECLRWAQKDISTQVIFIPLKYTSYVAPVSYSKMHSKLTVQERDSYYTVTFGWHWVAFDHKPIWHFSHPSQNSLSRHNILQFCTKQPIFLNGIIGTFDCHLFGNSTLSTVPSHSTPNCFSWFPIFFPFHQQQFLSQGESIIIQMNRHSQHSKVYYEWKYIILSVDKKIKKKSNVHNEKGRSLSIRLQ